MYIRLATGPVAILAAVLLLVPLLSRAGGLHGKEAAMPLARRCEHAGRICAMDPADVCCLQEPPMTTETTRLAVLLATALVLATCYFDAPRPIAARPLAPAVAVS